MKHARFITSASNLKGFPKLDNPEIAICGRSNVGKSSLINHLFQTKGIARVSSTPGKTQLINFFEFDDLIFADLPGYGFAKVPESVRKEWGPMLDSYFTSRPQLKLILFLIDIRRLPNEDDFVMMDWIQKSGKEVIAIITKTDKVNQSELAKNTKAIREKLSIEKILPYTITRTKPREILLHMIHKAVK